MDLGAFTQIDNLDIIADLNGIDVPRLRGYRLMKDEKPVSKEEIDEMIKDEILYTYEEFCKREPFGVMNAYWIVSSDATDRLKEKYLIVEKTPVKEIFNGKEIKYYRTKTIGFRWDKLHGKPRKVLKYLIKRKVKRVKAQWELWNKYAGQENVLYIHSRTGGWTRADLAEYGWADYRKEPWFLDTAQDGSDWTYCDIYARIDKWPTETEIKAWKEAHPEDEED